MKSKKISIRTFFWLVIIGLISTSAFLLLIFYLFTGNGTLVLYGLFLTVVFLGWGMLFLKFFQNKLSEFTDNLCLTLDNMIGGNERPITDMEAETVFARISYRLERLYDIMQQSRLRVEEEKAEIQALVSDISHQTKTPIANLKMINDTLLTREMSKEKQADFLQAMGSQLDKLDFLIQAMVKTSRLETGVITLGKKTVSFTDTLTAALNSVLAPLEKKRITLSVDCPDNLTFPHDSRWTAEALYNILDNAVKYTSAYDSIHVDVQEWEMYIKIDVSDTGRGIPEKEQASIFRRFYREEAVHAIDGIGIGLYLAREIITMQGGFIKVDSIVGNGSTFSVFLPKK
ncbi:sensor histidine kinase [Mediterraneibacter agrestimuris]|uniref:sensor histidine kinase n=1 Tax=Mediterraneibacter agrestimuris TaxID=2941333 RepID=UPI00203DD9CA|nr:HAMP domain-containing sensor histidine kinase [Mediterraneibacter agrestimuris]